MFVSDLVKKIRKGLSPKLYMLLGPSLLAAAVAVAEVDEVIHSAPVSNPVNKEETRKITKLIPGKSIYTCPDYSKDE